MTDMTVANTILEQLGGSRFIFITGARACLGNDRSLSFRLPGAGFCKDGINYVKITLNTLDTYDMEFLTIRGKNSAVKGSMEGVYADQLRDIFTRYTGLQVSLGTMKGK